MDRRESEGGKNVNILDLILVYSQIPFRIQSKVLSVPEKQDSQVAAGNGVPPGPWDTAVLTRQKGGPRLAHCLLASALIHIILINKIGGMRGNWSQVPGKIRKNGSLAQTGPWRTGSTGLGAPSRARPRSFSSFPASSSQLNKSRETLEE